MLHKWHTDPRKDFDCVSDDIDAWNRSGLDLRKDKGPCCYSLACGTTGQV